MRVGRDGRSCVHSDHRPTRQQTVTLNLTVTSRHVTTRTATIGRNVPEHPSVQSTNPNPRNTRNAANVCDTPTPATSATPRTVARPSRSYTATTATITAATAPSDTRTPFTTPITTTPYHPVTQ